jgi:hypothetical protein
MNATRDLIAAALTAADVFELSAQFEDEKNAVEELREACARAMVQPAAPAAWQVWCGLGNMQPYWPVFRTKEEAEECAKTIKTYTEVRPLWSHASAASQPISAAEVPMPEPNYDGYDLIDRFLRNNLDDDDYAEYVSGLQQYGDTREAAGYARGLAEERERCAVKAWTHYMDTCKRNGIGPDVYPQWCCAAALRSGIDRDVRE